MKKTLFFLLTAMLLQSMSFSQAVITGQIIDSSNSLPLAGANVINAVLDRGATTDLQGKFRLEMPQGTYILKISMVGYIDKLHEIDISTSRVELEPIGLIPAVIGLAEVNIIAGSAVERQTPVPVSNITALTIDNQLGDRPFPTIMNMVPGVYATRTGGGSGDAALNIRGFKQENIALMLNGIPINSVENGLVYWNNWVGLSDITQQLQVQRGLGASKVAQNSVGGTVNIITKTTDVEKGGSISFDYTSYGNSKMTLVLSTGKLTNDVAITFLGSRFSGPGYVDATYADGWAYFLSVSKDINARHKLVFTLLGNPERHGQRNLLLTDAETQEHGLKYNKDWGSYNGEINNASENFYHKPNISLNHYWDISKKSFLASSAYVSFGYGGGKWSDTYGNNPGILNYYNPSGQIDWDAIYEINETNTDTFTLTNGVDTTGFSINVQTNFLASHVWAGVLSTFHHRINDRFNLMAGIHARYFKSKLQQKVRDLLGGDFYIDPYSYAVDGVAGRNQVKNVGDIVKVDNGALVNYVSLFSQVEYDYGPLVAFLAGTVNYTWYGREDRYNYISDTKSEIVTRPGFDIKLGLNYNLNEYHNLYFNTGYFSKAPYHKFVFGGFNNIPTTDLENEKVLGIELGYGLNFHNTRARLNGYITRWKDKSILTKEYNQFENPAMIQGLDADHSGIELEFSQGFLEKNRIGIIASFGNWKWKNDVNAFIFSLDNVIVDTVNVYSSGLYVGDAPQTQVGVFGVFKILDLFNLNVEWTFYDKLFADFDPAKRTDPDDDSQSYQLPAYNNLDIHLGYAFHIGRTDAYVGLSCYNTLNQEYIIRALDGYSHNRDSMTGFWGFGRTISAFLKINF